MAYQREVDPEEPSEKIWELLEDMDQLGDSIELIPSSSISEIEFTVYDVLHQLEVIRTKIEQLEDA